MQGAGYGGTGSVQAGYGQTDASAAYSQTQNVYAGYTQQTGTDYYQQAAAAAASGYQANTGQQMTAGQQTAAQGWPVMPQQAGQQQQQQYWPTPQQTASWPGTGHCFCFFFLYNAVTDLFRNILRSQLSSNVWLPIATENWNHKMATNSDLF